MKIYTTAHMADGSFKLYELKRDGWTRSRRFHTPHSATCA